MTPDPGSARVSGGGTASVRRRAVRAARGCVGVHSERLVSVRDAVWRPDGRHERGCGLHGGQPASPGGKRLTEYQIIWSDVRSNVWTVCSIMKCEERPYSMCFYGRDYTIISARTLGFTCLPWHGVIV